MALASGVTVVVQPSDLWAEGDPRRSRQVLTNFVSNALKFSPSGSTLSLGVTRADAEVRFEVSAQGPGIPESFRPQVFEPFAQAESAADRSVGGTGLGLAICRAMVEAQGGEIGFDCAPGGGTTFWFTLAAVEPAVVPPSGG